MRNAEINIIVRFLKGKMKDRVYDKTKLDSRDYINLCLADNIIHYIGKQICILKEN